MFQAVTHIALAVPDVPRAVDYYRSLFGMQLAFRDVSIEGAWYGLRPDSDWMAADGADDLTAALHRGGLVLALEQGGDAPPGRLHHIGLRVTLEDLADLRIRVHEHEVDVEQNRADLMVFRDRYGVRWEAGLTAYDNPAALGTGPRTGRWWPAAE